MASEKFGGELAGGYEPVSTGGGKDREEVRCCRSVVMVEGGGRDMGEEVIVAKDWASRSWPFEAFSSASLAFGRG